MTDERMQLKALLEKTADADLLNEMIGFAANRLMELEADGLCNAGRHERSAILFSGLPGASAHVGAGADRRHLGSLRARHLDTIRRRSGEGDGHDRHFEERGCRACAP